jgi:hypothetical protein
MRYQLVSLQNHADSRYNNITSAVIHELQHAYAAGRDLGSVFSHIDRDTAAIFVAESLEADRIWNLSPSQIFDPVHVKPDLMSEFKRAVLSEIFFELASVAHESGLEGSKEARNVAMSNLDQLARSPLVSPMLWYGGIFLDLAEEDRGTHDAIDWIKRALAHDLHYMDGKSAIELLRDLADMYLAAADLDTGLSILATLLHNDPAYIWTYNGMAISFHHYGLVDLGLAATHRGLALIDAQGDEEQLRGQLEHCLDSLAEADRRGRETEVDPDVLAEIRSGLALDFDAGAHQSLETICRTLVPDLDEIPVKRTMKPSDFPLPGRANVVLSGAGPSGVLPGRNDPCWCGSGKKYKHCHWRKDRHR